MYAAVPFKWGGAGVFHIDVNAEKAENMFTLVEMKHVSSPLFALEVFPSDSFTDMFEPYGIDIEKYDTSHVHHPTNISRAKAFTMHEKESVVVWIGALSYEEHDRTPVEWLRFALPRLTPAKTEEELLN